MTILSIHSTYESDFDTLTTLWEASVRATHLFLSEEDILALRPLVRWTYLKGVELRVYRDDAGVTLGFVGVAEGKVEMLFVSPEARGRGIGKALLRHAIEEMGAKLVDVNEQNPQAVGFYLHEGFEVVGRSPVDGQGRAFPLLEMRLRAH